MPPRDPNNQTLTVRLPDELLRRIDRVAANFALDPTDRRSPFSPTDRRRSSITRLLLTIGLERLEAQTRKRR